MEINSLMQDVVMVMYQLKLLDKVGSDGKVFAVDVYPDSIDIVKNEIKKRNIKNIEAIVADITKKLPLNENSIDLALMANVLHGFVDGGEVDQVMSNIVKGFKTWRYICCCRIP